MKHLLTLFFAALILTCPLQSTALEYTWGQVHGFLSQGYLDSRKNNFLAPDSEEGTFDINEFGINFNANLTGKLRIGAQFLSRDLGFIGDNDVRVDWALADYRFIDQFGIRAGKVKMPMGLYNTTRDSDFLRPMVFLPQSIYDETRRDLVLSHLGAEAYGNMPVAEFGDLDYHFFGGQVDFDDESFLDRAFTATASKMADMSPIIPSLNDLELENDYIFGGALIYNTAVDGLRYGVSFMRAKNDIYINGALQGELDMKGKLICSIEYLWGNFTFAAEYGQTHRLQKLYNQTNIDGKTMEWYAMLSWAVTDKITLTSIYEEFYRDREDKDGLFFITRGQPDYYAWRKDTGFGIRYDFNRNWTLKGDWHFIDGASLFLDVINKPKAERYWQYGVIKASFNF